jgi:hypothetical protein
MYETFGPALHHVFQYSFRDLYSELRVVMPVLNKATSIFLSIVSLDQEEL